MDIKALRKLKPEELTERLGLKVKEYNDCAYDLKIGREQDYSKKNKLQKEVARIKTLINEQGLINNES